MTSVDDIYQLLNPDEPRWETFTASGRAWQDRLANRDALATRNSAVPGRPRRIGRTHSQIDDDTAAIGQREQEWRLWRGGPALVRSEYSIGKEIVTVVGQGPRWWRWSPVLGATSGGGAGRPLRLLLGPAGVLVESERLFEQLEIAVVGEATVAGRMTHRIDARPIAQRGRARLALREAGLGADRYELKIDAERGILLAVEAFVGEQPFQTVEVTDVAFDVVLSPDLFSPERSSGERFAKSPATPRTTIDQVAAQVDFTFLVPSPPPSTVPPYVALFDGDRRGSGPRHAVVTYAIVDPAVGRGQLRITEADSELPRSAREEWSSAGSFEIAEERHGRVSRRRIRATMSGTFVEIESALLSTEQLVEVVRSLVPYRHEGLAAFEPGDRA